MTVMTRNPFAYGFLRLMVYAHQDGQKFYLTLSSVNELGLTPTRQPVLWIKAPKLRGARKWFKAHAAAHGLEFVFDR
jgi:hypothetical protein